MADPFQAVAIGAATAALGYVVNLAGRSVDQYILRRSARKSSLIDLQSQLLASKSAFIVQAKLRNRLSDEVEKAMPELAGLGYDEMLADAYPNMTEEQKRTHGLIRAYTVKAIKPLNEAMSVWLKLDRDFKHKTDKLGFALQDLEAHLVLWHAKYEFWIPDHPERTLVYLADEERHGVGFPSGIEDLVMEKTARRTKAA